MATTKWSMDPSHSELEFKVRHMMISTVTGHFKKFDVTVETDGDDFSSAKIQFTADVDTVSTNNEQRDGHLKSPDFFDAANHPQIKFESDRMEKVSDSEYKLHGNLTIRDVTKPVSFEVEYGGTVNDPWGNERAGFSLHGKVNRKEYGLMWHAVTEAGGVVAGDDVKFNANLEFVKQKEAQAV